MERPLTSDQIRRRKYNSLGLCGDCGKPKDEKFSKCQMCLVRHREKAKRYNKRYTTRYYNKERNRQDHLKLKLLVLSKYGTVCQCCGEDQYQFLSIDHIDGNGAEHRRQIFGNPRGGGGWYRWLRRNGFPPGYRVLCLNCNFAYGFYKVCPHKIPRAQAEVSA